MNLNLQHCSIRDWREADVDSLVMHANNRKIWRNLRDRFPHPYTRADAEGWISLAREAVPGTNFALAVNEVAVGGIGLELRGDVFRRSAEVGFWLGESYWGQGLTTQALGAFSEWAFAQFDLVRLHASVFGWNPASARVLEKAGYTLEGRLRMGIFKDRQFTDECVYARLRPSLPPASGT